MTRELQEQIEGKRAAIEEICQRCHVMRLELFGSATSHRFDPAHSDLDFLVSFMEGCTSLDNYLPLAEGLEQLLGRPVDLVIERALRNPYLLQSINATRRLVYEHRAQEIAV